MTVWSFAATDEPEGEEKKKIIENFNIFCIKTQHYSKKFGVCMLHLVPKQGERLGDDRQHKRSDRRQSAFSKLSIHSKTLTRDRKSVV